jgi:hypothetical protein
MRGLKPLLGLADESAHLRTVHSATLARTPRHASAPFREKTVTPSCSISCQKVLCTDLACHCRSSTSVTSVVDAAKRETRSVHSMTEDVHSSVSNAPVGAMRSTSMSLSASLSPRATDPNTMTLTGNGVIAKAALAISSKTSERKLQSELSISVTAEPVRKCKQRSRPMRGWKARHFDRHASRGWQSGATEQLRTKPPTDPNADLCAAGWFGVGARKGGVGRAGEAVLAPGLVEHD